MQVICAPFVLIVTLMGPDRKEIMTAETMQQILDVLKNRS
jgi:hypothetical protein